MAKGSGSEAVRDDSVRRIGVVRGRHHWTLVCARGEEAQLLRHLADCAARPDCPLDPMDLAVISHQLSAGVGPGLNPVTDKAD